MCYNKTLRKLWKTQPFLLSFNKLSLVQFYLNACQYFKIYIPLPLLHMLYVYITRIMCNSLRVFEIVWKYVYSFVCFLSVKLCKLPSLHSKQNSYLIDDFHTNICPRLMASDLTRFRITSQAWGKF